MKFEEVIPALREGKKIRRKSWGAKNHNYIVVDKEDDLIVDMVYGKFPFTLGDLIADDWEIVTEKKKVKLRDLTVEQFKKWIDENCNKCDFCKGCPFKCIECYDTFWLSHKDMFSDKFLDQEVEIED